jgi:hypothetical protein
MEAAAHSQAVAVLFLASGLEVAVECLPGVHVFRVENSAAGLQAFERELVGCQLRAPPFICMGSAPGAQLAAPFFTEMHDAPFPKFIMAQPMFIEYAASHSLSAQSSESLLRAFRDKWPRSAHAV